MDKEGRKYFFSILLLSFCLIGLSQNKDKSDSILLRLSKSNLSQKEKYYAFSDLAFYHPNLDSALIYANKSLVLSEEIGNPLLKAEVLEEISHLERRLGNNEKSFDASFNALKIYESKKMLEQVAASYTQLASNYISDEDFKKGVYYLKLAKEIYNQSPEKTRYALTQLNLGEAYRLRGYLDSAQTSFQETLKLNISLKNDIILGYSLGNLGMVHNAQDSLALAQKELGEAITILKTLGDPYSTSVYLAELGQVYQKEGKSQQAEDKLLDALVMAKEAGLKEQIRDFSASLSQFYTEQQDFKQALAYQKQFQVYQDSLVNKENVQKIEQLKAGYEIEKRESQIGLLNKINSNQRNLLFTLGGGILLTLIFTYLLYKANRNIKKANQTLSEQKELLAKREQEKAWLLRELNHRVKNNLQMISSLLNLQSRELAGHPAKEAILAGQKRVEALSLVHQKLYQEGVDTKIVAKEYVEDLVLGLFHGYNAPFEPTFAIADIHINIDTAIPLALIINELIINSLKYAYTGVANPSLKIVMEAGEENRLHLDIVDNGVGFNPKNKKQNSFGIKLINSLIQQLEGTIKKMEGQGTHWKMDLKIA